MSEVPGTAVSAIPATNDPTHPGIKPGWKTMVRKSLENMKKRMSKKRG